MYMAGGDFGKFYVNDDIHWQYCAPKPPETGRKRTSRVITTGCSILLAGKKIFERPEFLATCASFCFLHMYYHNIF